MCCNRGKTIIRKSANIVTGFAYLAGGINEELSSTRVKFCDACPELRGGVTCNLCGCNVHAKTRLNNEVCPLGKW